MQCSSGTYFDSSTLSCQSKTSFDLVCIEYNADLFYETKIVIRVVLDAQDQIMVNVILVYSILCLIMGIALRVQRALIMTLQHQTAAVYTYARIASLVVFNICLN